MPVIGFLGAVSSEGFLERLNAFRQGLKDTGYAEGENVVIEYRWAENQVDRHHPNRVRGPRRPCSARTCRQSL